ncbi:hypothetical protein CYMTET_43945 [Cymbomonas tetramitiformis]|uniref:Uncharacterized protein n=1 Tax=Cymbomonas tetramitiformis TaxID=36881 RepID=A0AAE0F165_9CHLO|nr:hypothetical protein CYMTET_43945 [Cymbomonas tetramitiformis]
MTFESILDPLEEAFSANASSDGTVSQLDALCILADFGLLKSVDVSLFVNKIVEGEMRPAGTKVSRESFGRCFAAALRLRRSKATGFVIPRTFPQQRLKELFTTLAGSSGETSQMSAATFKQAVSEASLGRKITPAAIDVIFANVRKPGNSNITFEQFAHAISLLSAQIGVTFDKFAHAISLLSAQIGVTFDKVATTMLEAHASVLKPVSSSSRNKELRGVFLAFVAFGAKGDAEPPKNMDGVHFAKLCRECGIMDAQFTSISVDIIFTKCKPKGARRLEYKDFLQALSLVSIEKSIPYETVVEYVLRSGGPKSNNVTGTTEFRFRTAH